VLAALCTSDLVTLSLHDALPILFPLECRRKLRRLGVAISRQRVANWLRKKFFRFPSWEPARKGGESKNWRMTMPDARVGRLKVRSEEHTSELQSRENLVCRLLLE